MPKKSIDPFFIVIKLLYKMGQDFLDGQYLPRIEPFRDPSLSSFLIASCIWTSVYFCYIISKFKVQRKIACFSLTYYNLNVIFLLSRLNKQIVTVCLANVILSSRIWWGVGSCQQVPYQGFDHDNNLTT